MPIFVYGATMALFVFLAFNGSGVSAQRERFHAMQNRCMTSFSFFYFHLFADYGLGIYKNRKVAHAMNEARLYADNFGAAFSAVDPSAETGFLHFLRERMTADGGGVKSPAICISLHSTMNPKKAVITSTNVWTTEPKTS